MDKVPKSKKRFINLCSLTFKTFEHNVTEVQNRALLWDFIAESKRNNKKYAVCCVPQFSRIKSLIKIAKSKLPPSTRLIVITEKVTRQEGEEALEKDFCLTTFQTVQDFNTRMLNIL